MRRLIACCITRLAFGLLTLLGSAVCSDAAERRLTRDGLLKRDPIYVDRGRAIVYAVRAPSPRMVLMRLDLARLTAARLHPKSILVEFRPTLSADQRTLAFQRMTGNDVCRLFVEQLDSGREQALATGRKTSFNAALSPDGKSVAYNLSGQLYRRPLSGGAEEKLAHSAGRNDWPAWSPDSQQIAFASSRHGDFDLYRVTLGTDRVSRLTRSPSLKEVELSSGFPLAFFGEGAHRERDLPWIGRRTRFLL